jgi:hypothetical protein
VDPDPELFGQIGSGPGTIVPDPYLTFSTRKSVYFWKIFHEMVQFVIYYIRTVHKVFSKKNSIKSFKSLAEVPLCTLKLVLVI